MLPWASAFLRCFEIDFTFFSADKGFGFSSSIQKSGSFWTSFTSLANIQLPISSFHNPEPRNGTSRIFSNSSLAYWNLSLSLEGWFRFSEEGRSLSNGITNPAVAIASVSVTSWLRARDCFSYVFKISEHRLGKPLMKFEYDDISAPIQPVNYWLYGIFSLQFKFWEIWAGVGELFTALWFVRCSTLAKNIVNAEYNIGNGLQC